MTDIDVTDQEQLEAFLREAFTREGGLQQVVAFAVRTVLRGSLAFVELPLEARSGLDRTIVLPCFRAMAAPWVAATYPTHGAARAAALATEAARAAARAADGARAASLAALAARTAARAAARSGDTARAAGLAGLTSRAGLAGLAGPALDAAFAADAADLSKIRHGEPITRSPLWPGGVPNWAEAGWASLRMRLLDLDPSWRVWTEWYEARLRGGPTHPELSEAANERIEVARVLEVEDDDWKRDPTHVNAKIEAIIERETERDLSERSPDTESDPPAQIFSSVRAVWKDKYVINDQTPVGAELEKEAQVAALQAIRDELIELASALDKETNVDDRPADHMRRTAELIPADLPTATELHRLIRREAAMLNHMKIVQDEWPDFLADEYVALTDGFTEALNRFADRREVRRSDFSAALDGTDSEAARQDLLTLTQKMRATGKALIDPSVPETIETIASEIPESGPLTELPARLATVDGFESANNVLKAIADGGEGAGKKELAIQFLDEVIKDVGAKALEDGARKGAREFLEKEAEIGVKARLTHLHLKASRPWLEHVTAWLPSWLKRQGNPIKISDDDT